MIVYNRKIALVSYEIYIKFLIVEFLFSAVQACSGSSNRSNVLNWCTGTTFDCGVNRDLKPAVVFPPPVASGYMSSVVGW